MKALLCAAALTLYATDAFGASTTPPDAGLEKLREAVEKIEFRAPYLRRRWPVNPAQVEIGRQLIIDGRLSSNKTKT